MNQTQWQSVSLILATLYACNSQAFQQYLFSNFKSVFLKINWQICQFYVRHSNSTYSRPSNSVFLKINRQICQFYVRHYNSIYSQTSIKFSLKLIAWFVSFKIRQHWKFPSALAKWSWRVICLASMPDDILALTIFHLPIQ